MLFTILKIPTAQLSQQISFTAFTPTVMNTNGKFDCAIWPLYQVIEKILHCEECVWMKVDGTRCRNIVPKSSRVDGAVCLQALQDLSLNYSTTQGLAVAGKFFLCSECRRYRCRPRQWAQHLICQLNTRADQTKFVATPSLLNRAGGLQQRQGQISQPFRIDTSAWLRLTSPTR